MALNAMQQNVVSNAIQDAQSILLSLKPRLDILDAVYNSSGGLGSTLQQSDLDAVPSFSGLTTTQLADGVYALSTIRNEINTALVALEQLAARA